MYYPPARETQEELFERKHAQYIKWLLSVKDERPLCECTEGRTYCQCEE